MERKNTRQTKPLLLWLDFSFRPQDRELRIASARYFRVEYSTRLDRALEDAGQLAPDALCFEFDRPDEARLRTLRDVLRSQPQLPVLLLTVEHSESLAVWAFRAGVWNVLAKPVAEADFVANMRDIAQVAAGRHPPRLPRPPGADAPQMALAPPVDEHLAQLHPALQYVRRHYGDKITEEEAAQRCGLHRFAFSRAFHATFGMTFREFVMHVRIDEARRLLVEGGHTVTEVAFATGFTDGSYFARVFRRYTGTLPSKYQAPSSELPPASR
jgi:AraC-like DNA-binding protein/ActR/RegA family two-component response regulator